MGEEHFDELMETVDEQMTRMNDLTVAIEKLTAVIDFVPNRGFGEYE